MMELVSNAFAVQLIFDNDCPSKIYRASTKQFRKMFDDIYSSIKANEELSFVEDRVLRDNLLFFYHDISKRIHDPAGESFSTLANPLNKFLQKYSLKVIHFYLKSGVDVDEVD